MWSQFPACFASFRVFFMTISHRVQSPAPPPQFSRVSGGWGGARGRIPRTRCTTRMASLAAIFLCVPVLIFGNFQLVAANPDAKRLYDDLLSNYNKLVRPVVNTSDVLRVCIKLKLSQLIDVVSCNLWPKFLDTIVFPIVICKVSFMICL